MKRKEVVKLLRKLCKLKVCEDSYFYLIENKSRILFYIEYSLRYNKCTGVKMLLQKFSKIFLEIVESFGWREEFEEYLNFFRKAYELSFVRKEIVKLLLALPFDIGDEKY